MNSKDIKLALMWYFRFKRQWLCATECRQWDVVAFTDKHIIEVEVKVNKYDLWKGEAKKDKHTVYKNAPDNMTPNKYYVGVTKDLLEEAIKWTDQTNYKYGIILCEGMYDVMMYRTASLLKEGYDGRLKQEVMKRICTENIMFMKKKRAAEKEGSK
jgi:hypothetical protein